MHLLGAHEALPILLDGLARELRRSRCGGLREFGEQRLLALLGHPGGARHVDDLMLDHDRHVACPLGADLLPEHLLALAGSEVPLETLQAYEDGMRFLQFYFGLPLAMIILSVTLVPFFYRSRVYTAYEYLEQRFDAKTRTLIGLAIAVGARHEGARHGPIDHRAGGRSGAGRHFQSARRTAQ